VPGEGASGEGADGERIRESGTQELRKEEINYSV